MTATVDHTEELRSRMTGAVLGAADPGYDDGRRVWNATIDHRPAVLAYCTGTADVVAAVDHARRHGLAVAVRCGAHNAAGMSAGDGTLVVDLTGMNAVAVDPGTRRVTVGGGALLRDIDAAAQEHGLAVPAGEIGHTGVGGLTLGGGMGWLTRRAGLTIDRLVSAEVVLADGRVVRASADEHPDLFWALRGGGGNFGIVTEFEFDAVPVGPTVSLGLFFFGLDDGAAVLRAARDLIPDLPGTVGFQLIALHAPPEPFVPEDMRHRPCWAVAVVGTTGAVPDPDAEQVHDRVRATFPPRLFEFCTPMPFTALQQTFDEAYGWGRHCYEKFCYLPPLTDAVIDVLTEQVVGKVSPLSVVHLYTLDNAFSAVGENATAFGGGRSPRLAVFLIGFSPDAAGLPTETAWVRRMYAALAPHAIGSGAYVNSLMGDDTGRVRASYGDKYDRLEDAMNSRRLDLLDEILAPDFLRHCEATPDFDVRSREDFKEFLRSNTESFPDNIQTFTQVVADGDRAGIWAIYEGTQSGALGPFPPSGRRTRFGFGGVLRVADGRIAELWVTWDNMTILAARAPTGRGRRGPVTRPGRGTLPGREPRGPALDQGGQAVAGAPLDAFGQGRAVGPAHAGSRAQIAMAGPHDAENGGTVHHAGESGHHPVGDVGRRRARRSRKRGFGVIVRGGRPAHLWCPRGC